jgi:integrase
MRGKISKRTVDDLVAGDVLWDTELKGFVARKLNSGHVSYGLKYTDRATGGQRWLALGLHGALTPELARRMAQAQRGRIAAGADPQAERKAEKVRRTGIVTVNDLLDAHIKLYINARQLRSRKDIVRTFDKLVRPRIGKVAVKDLKRSHIVALLDRIASHNGPVMADRTLAHLRKALNWHATRDDEFVVPIVRGMAQTRPSERARDRILSDGEIRVLWRATEFEAAGGYGILLRVLLLTAQRRQEVADMRHGEIDGDVWVLPAERAKNKRPNTVPLTAQVRELIALLPPYGDSVFGQTGKTAYSGFSKSKRLLDERLKRETAVTAPGATGWVIHDLRRTARSLMSRAGVRPDIAERVLNHAIGGVQGVYDRHDYVEEKRAALVALGSLVADIVAAPDNVVALAERRLRGTVEATAAPRTGVARQ